MRAALPALLVLSGCGATVERLAYAPTVTPGAAGQGAVRVAPPNDARSRPDPTYVGTIRTGIGTPLKTVRTAGPFANEGLSAVSDALTQQSLLFQTAAATQVRLTIVRIDSSQRARSEAHAGIRAQVMGVGSGRVLWEGSGKSDQESGTVLTLDRGVFASTAVLAVLASKALNVAIDQIVGDPAFRRAVSGAGARVG